MMFSRIREKERERETIFSFFFASLLDISSRFDNCFFCSIDDVTIKAMIVNYVQREEQIERLVHLCDDYLIISTTPYTNTLTC